MTDRLADAALVTDAQKYLDSKNPGMTGDVIVFSAEVWAACQRLAAAWPEMVRELALWKPMTPAEAEKAFDGAKAVPLSEDRIREIVRKAMDPATRLPNDEQAQLAAENERLRSQLAAREPTPDDEAAWERLMKLNGPSHRKAELSRILAEARADERRKTWLAAAETIMGIGKDIICPEEAAEVCRAQAANPDGEK